MILGGSKMKLMNLIKIAPMVLMVFALSTQARGDENMKRGITRQIEPIDETFIYLESEESTYEVEGWMMESGYLGAESQPVEDWMLEASYLDISSDFSVESWMMDPGYLAQ